MPGRVQFRLQDCHVTKMQYSKSEDPRLQLHPMIVKKFDDLKIKTISDISS